jgi:hypothetical protein
VGPSFRTSRPPSPRPVCAPSESLEWRRFDNLINSTARTDWLPRLRRGQALTARKPGAPRDSAANRILCRIGSAEVRRYFCSDLGRRVVNLNAQHRVSHQQFCCRLLGCTLFREMILVMPIDDHRVPMCGRDVGPLNGSWLLLFEPESRFFHERFLRGWCCNAKDCDALVPESQGRRPELCGRTRARLWRGLRWQMTMSPSDTELLASRIVPRKR